MIIPIDWQARFPRRSSVFLQGVCTHASVCVCICVCVCVCVCACVRVHMCVFAWICASSCVIVCMCACICVSLCVHRLHTPSLCRWPLLRLVLYYRFIQAVHTCACYTCAYAILVHMLYLCICYTCAYAILVHAMLVHAMLVQGI